MPTIKVEYKLEVRTEAGRIWDILADVKSWPGWQGTTYIKPCPPEPVKEGSSFVVELGGLKWKLTVTKAERPQKIYWIGRRMGLRGIHEWEFSEEEGKTRVVTRESMSGWLLLPLYPIVKTRLSRTDEKWLADLKSRAESP